MERMEWKDLTLSQYNDIKVIQDNENLDDMNKMIMIVSVLSGIDQNSIKAMPLTQFNELADKYTAFMKAEPKYNNWTKTRYRLNGTNYSLNLAPQTFTVSQIMDYSSFIREHDIIKMLSIVLIPENHGYCDGYDIDKVMNDIAGLPAMEGLSIANFFTHQFLAYVKGLHAYSLRMMKKGMKKVKDPEKLKEIEEKYELLQKTLSTITY